MAPTPPRIRTGAEQRQRPRRSRARGKCLVGGPGSGRRNCRSGACHSIWSGRRNCRSGASSPCPTRRRCREFAGHRWHPPSGRSESRPRRRPGRGAPGGPRTAEGEPAAGEGRLPGRRMDEAPILDEIEALAASRRVKVDVVSRRRIDSLARTDAAQGVVALARPVEETSLESLCETGSRGRMPFLLVLDGITDPHNVGALLRSAECAGVTGVNSSRHRSAHLSPTVTKTAAGAIEHLPMALVAGIPTTIQRLSGRGIWTVGLVEKAKQSLYGLSLGDQPVALVLGSEDTGLSPLASKRCDVLASIPQHGTLPSLNVSVAGAVACFDVARQRHP